MENENCPFRVYKPLPIDGIDAPMIFSMCELDSPERLAGKFMNLWSEYADKKRELEVLRRGMKQTALLYMEAEEQRHG